MRMWVVEAANKTPKSGGNNWIEIVTPDLRKAFHRVELLTDCQWLAKAPVTLKLYETQTRGKIFVVEEPFDHAQPKAYGWNYRFFDIAGVKAYLKAIKRIPLDGDKGAKKGAPDQYCLIQPMPAEGFDNPCPGIDMMGLMDHEHVDNWFLKAFDNLSGRAVSFFRQNPAKHIETALANEFWRERIEKYIASQGDGF
jgi:hypothetical protein